MCVYIIYIVHWQDTALTVRRLYSSLVRAMCHSTGSGSLLNTTDFDTAEPPSSFFYRVVGKRRGEEGKEKLRIECMHALKPNTTKIQYAHSVIYRVY